MGIFPNSIQIAGISPDTVKNPFGQHLWIIFVHQEAVYSVVYDILRSAATGRNHRYSRSHGFEYDNAESLGSAGQYEQITGFILIYQIFSSYFSSEAYVIVQIQIFDELHICIFLVPVPDKVNLHSL